MRCKIITAVLLSLVSTGSLSQPSVDSNKFSFSIGIKNRITPIYLKKVFDVITVSNRNVLEQPDMHLTGFSVVYSIERELGSGLFLAFSQNIRYDLLYKRMQFYNVDELRGLNLDVKKIMTDFELKFYSVSDLDKSKLYLGLGMGIFNIGSDYLLTQLLIDDRGDRFYVSTSENFQFPGVSASAGWKKNKFYSEVTIGYCWENPTIFKQPFLFPEIKFQYQLFTFGK